MKKHKCENCGKMFNKDDLIFYKPDDEVVSVRCKKCDKKDEDRYESPQKRELKGQDCLEAMQRNHTRFNRGMNWESRVLDYEEETR